MNDEFKIEMPIKILSRFHLSFFILLELIITFKLKSVQEPISVAMMVLIEEFTLLELQ
jgi:hypothetical protein